MRTPHFTIPSRTNAGEDGPGRPRGTGPALRARMAAQNPLPHYPDFATFVLAEVLSLHRADPSARRLDGHGRGGNPAPVATFEHGGARWQVNADTHVARALLAYAARLDGELGLVEVAAPESARRRLVVDPALLPPGAPARFYAYEVG